MTLWYGDARSDRILLSRGRFCGSVHVDDRTGGDAAAILVPHL